MSASSEAPAPQDAAPAAEPIYVLPWNAKGLIWPAVHMQDLMLIFGMFWFPLLVAYFLARFIPIMLWPGVVIAVLTVLLALILGIRKLRAKMREKPYSGPLPKGDTGRLRVLAPRDKLCATLDSFNDVPFEPIILRCIQDASFGELDEQGSPKLVKRKKPSSSKNQLAQAEPYTTRALALASLASFIMGIAVVLVMHRLSTGSWWRGFRTEMMWSGLALGTLIAALAKPSYVRIAPGSLDVLIYPPLGFGPPFCEHFNLRSASITVDEKHGRISVLDPSRPQRQVLFLRPRWVLTRASFSGLLLNAARSSHPTPALPTDALLG